MCTFISNWGYIQEIMKTMYRKQSAFFYSYILLSKSNFIIFCSGLFLLSGGSFQVSVPLVVAIVEKRQIILNKKISIRLRIFSYQWRSVINCWFGFNLSTPEGSNQREGKGFRGHLLNPFLGATFTFSDMR